MNKNLTNELFDLGTILIIALLMGFGLFIGYKKDSKEVENQLLRQHIFQMNALYQDYRSIQYNEFDVIDEWEKGEISMDSLHVATNTFDAERAMLVHLMMLKTEDLARKLKDESRN